MSGAPGFAGGYLQASSERKSCRVQAKLAANAVARQVRLKGSPAILTGRIFDDRGNRMSPTHSNKGCVGYRYYVSHAIVQQRKAESGSEIERNFGGSRTTQNNIAETALCGWAERIRTAEWRSVPAIDTATT